MISAVLFLFGLFCYVLGGLFGRASIKIINKFPRKYKDQLKLIFLDYADYTFIATAFLTLTAFTLLGIFYFAPYNIINKADVIQTLIFGATFFTLFYSVIIKDNPSIHRNRPVLTVKFKFKEPDCHLTTITMAAGANVESYYNRFRVENSGKTTLKNVQVILEKVKTGNTVVNSYLPLNLTWALTESERSRAFVDIPQGVFRTVDMFKILNPTQAQSASQAFSNIPILANRVRLLSNCLGVCGVSEPNNFSDILPYGNYIFYFTISADNAPPLYAKFSVKYNGSWSNNPQTMFSTNLKIKFKDSSLNKDDIF